ncbi:hypothetical protein [Tahibacter caeni]|uniref:hypothetical protein n=1 Tax=Tahibacter caeni TaxID=1453545 RepID=UPI002148492A|nr:hypothetical protein [Tahibacter caeni]
MAVRLRRTLHQLRNTRDLRAELLSLAASLLGTRGGAELVVTDPLISEATVRREWEQLLPALASDLRERLILVVESNAPRLGEKHADYEVGSGLQQLQRPNYRFEILRQLLRADLDNAGPQPVKALLEAIGASQTPIRAALAELREAGIVRQRGRSVAVRAEDVSVDLLAKLQAAPQSLRFRFERGAQIKPPALLQQRAAVLLGSTGPTGWRELALSGVAVARADVASFDLLGLPRLDLLAQLPRAAQTFDTMLLRLLDDGLEPEPSVLAPAPVVVTVTRADTTFLRDIPVDGARSARAMDVYLSLLDQGLAAQALHYAKALRA